MPSACVRTVRYESDFQNFRLSSLVDEARAECGGKSRFRRDFLGSRRDAYDFSVCTYGYKTIFRELYYVLSIAEGHASGVPPRPPFCFQLMLLPTAQGEAATGDPNLLDTEI